MGREVKVVEACVLGRLRFWGHANTEVELGRSGGARRERLLATWHVRLVWALLLRAAGGATSRCVLSDKCSVLELATTARSSSLFGIVSVARPTEANEASQATRAGHSLTQRALLVFGARAPLNFARRGKRSLAELPYPGADVL